MAAGPRARAGLTLAALLLAACAAPAPEGLAPRLQEAAAEARRIETPRGPLALSVWEAGQSRALLLALHGYGDYSPTTFAQAADGWAARGITTWAYDQRGFGRNPSNRDWPGAGALIEDLQAVAQAAAAQHPDLPLFVLGHSMGGGVALAAAGEGRLPRAEGLVLLAPAVWGGDTLNPLLRASAWVMAQVAPDMRFSNRAAPVRLQPTDNLDLLRRLAGDPLRFAEPSSREFLGLIRLMDRAVAAAPGAELPVLTVLGAHDEIVPEASIRGAHAALPGPKRFAYVPTGWHMLLRDLEGERVQRLVADWILERARL
ncbi:MAG: alpha/beta fold hydrolase [Pseudomonadota bacterium]